MEDEHKHGRDISLKHANDHEDEDEGKDAMQRRTRTGSGRVVTEQWQTAEHRPSGSRTVAEMAAEWSPNNG